MKSLRLLWITSVFYPEPGGGSGVHVYNCVKSLQKRGHRVTVVAARTDRGTPAEEIWPDGVRVVRYAGRFENPGRGIAAGRSCLNLLKNIDSDDYDAVLCGSLYSDRAAFKWIRRNKLPSIYFFYGPMDLEYKTELLGLARSKGVFARSVATLGLPLLGWWMKRQPSKHIAAAGAVATLSMHSQEIINRHFGLFPKIMTVIPGGANNEIYRPAEDKAALKKQLGYDQAQPLLLTVRRLIPRTGVDLLIDAMQSVVKKLPGAMLLIAGQGALKDELEKRSVGLGLRDRIKFLGYVTEEEKVRLYQAADFSVMPTTSLEGFGLSIAESLACDTPVLGTPVGSIPEILNRLDQSLVFKSLKPQDLAEGIVSFAGDQGLKTRLKGRTVEIARKYYSWDSAAEEIEKLAGTLSPGGIS
ncbi:glycosyltransferase family 4 protein [candidate division TA06 bacterium]|nr:glycosyltransferase family 4 protein [candidate division TA06 bacterium]